MRLIPVFPFWLVNFAGALVGMRLLPYALATLLGISRRRDVRRSRRGTGRRARLGRPAGCRRDLRAALLAPLAGLAVLALLPVLWRRFRKGSHA